MLAEICIVAPGPSPNPSGFHYCLQYPNVGEKVDREEMAFIAHDSRDQHRRYEIYLNIRGHSCQHPGPGEEPDNVWVLWVFAIVHKSIDWYRRFFQVLSEMNCHSAII